jgi:hypothetical protein
MNKCVCVCVCVADFPIAKLVQRTLYLQVFDYDRFSRDDPIGEVIIPLSDVDLSSTQTIWRSLQPCKGHAVSILELIRRRKHYDAVILYMSATFVFGAGEAG